MPKKKYFVMQDIFDFLFRYQFGTKDEYPFNGKSLEECEAEGNITFKS